MKEAVIPARSAIPASGARVDCVDPYPAHSHEGWRKRVDCVDPYPAHSHEGWRK